MKDGFDTEAFMREMGRTFDEYSELNHRALPELLKKRMVQLAIGSGGGHKGLFQEARDMRPVVQAEIMALPQKLNHRIKRYGRRTEAQEITSRLVQAGYFQASGWLVDGFDDIAGEGGHVVTNRGRLEMNLTGDDPSITLTNTSPRALEFGIWTGYIARAFYNQTQDMLDYIQKHLDLTVDEFNQKHPNFNKPIEAFIEST